MNSKSFENGLGFFEKDLGSFEKAYEPRIREANTQLTFGT